MGKDSKIEWTHHTFNPWRGCTKVSAGCAHCYAEKQSLRNPKVLGIWGDSGTRVIASESYWKQPIAWNTAAAELGERHRVFCASMADVFEDRQELEAPRHRLFRLIEATPHLDWLLLTKRPENMKAMTSYFLNMNNVWLGTSVENQEQADIRIPLLLQTPAKVRFLSCEPLLGHIDLKMRGRMNSNGERSNIDWVIVGGESGPHARPMHPEWARAIRYQCQMNLVPFFFKQWGEFSAEMPRFPPYPITHGFYGQNSVTMWRHGKSNTGHLLDEKEHHEFPIIKIGVKILELGGSNDTIR